ncbi:cytochrome P450 [Streptomyces griseoluteus]
MEVAPRGQRRASRVHVMCAAPGQEAGRDGVDRPASSSLPYGHTAAAVVRPEPELLPRAVEELLRHEPPVQTRESIPQAEIDIAGTLVPVGASVVLVLGSGNRDSMRFRDPDRFGQPHPGRALPPRSSGPGRPLRHGRQHHGHLRTWSARVNSTGRPVSHWLQQLV